MSATQVTIGNTVRRISGMIGRVTSTIIFEEGSVCEHFCSMRSSAIKSITLPDCIKELDEKAFYNCKELKSAKLPASLTTIPKSAFELCTSLESVTIPAGIVTIGEKAFYECKALEKITLPHTVSYIDSEAFRYCDYLEEMHLKSIEPPYLKTYWYEWDQAYYYPFDDCKYLDKIQVPDEGLAAYKASWSKYADIIVGGEPDGKHCDTPFATVTTLDATNIGISEAKLRGNLSMMTEVKNRILWFLISTDPNNLTTPDDNSIGVTIANTEEEYRAAVEDTFRYGDKIVVEQYIKGREFSVGVIDGKALPVIEIAPLCGFYDYKNKYQAGSAVETCPAELPDDITKGMQKAAEDAFKALRLKNYARMDFMMGETGDFYCLEANTLPGMTSTSLLPQEAAAVGIGFEDLCQKIVDMAL